MKTLVLGLDGAHWELIDPWIEAGHLPALERLRREGVWGDLQSCLPPVTCPNWKCYSTGKNPGKLGAFWWERLDRDSRKIETVDGSDFDSPELWDYLNAEGLSTAVVNMPTTYPPRPIDGWMIAGGPDASSDGYTDPPGLATRLETEYGYRIRPTDVGLLPENKETIATAIEDVIETRFEVARAAADEHDFVHLTIFYVNVLQHFFWRDPVVRRAWERIDENLVRLMERDANLIVMSDHGSNEIRRVFNVNAWLVREGYLRLQPGTADILSALGLTAENVKRLLDAVGEGWYTRAKTWTPDALAERVPTRDGSVRRGAKASKIDWDASTAVAGGQGPVYLLTDDDGLRDSLAAELESVSDPATGDQPVRRAHPGAELYHGDRMAHAPDVVIDQEPGWHVEGAVGTSDVFSPPGRWAAENKRTGLFALYGPAFASEGGPEDLSILDLAPTILHLHGLAVPDTLDGRVRRSVFAAGSAPAASPVERGPEYGRRTAGPRAQADTARDRLEDLGYL